MEEIEYLEEYEEIVMPQLLHNSIEEFLPTDDPYDLLPVDPAFDEFIEEDPLCSVYRNDFQFETTQADNNSNSGINNIDTIAILSSSITNSIIPVSASRTGGGVDSNSSSTIMANCIDSNNMIIVQSGITQTTSTTLVNVHDTNINDDENQHLEYIPTEIVETTVTYDNNEQQENNIDNNNSEIHTLSEVQNNNQSNIIYGNSYVTTSPAIMHDNGGGSGVKVLSCETLGTSAFLNVTPILTSPTSIQTTIINSPITSNGNRLIGTTSEYIRATHSSNNNINTNLSLLGLPLSPPALQYQLSSSAQSIPLLQSGIHQQQYNLSPSCLTRNSPQQQQIIATNRSKKISTIFQNNNLSTTYQQIIAIKSGLKTHNSIHKFKSLFRNNNVENLKGFDKLQECSMKKTCNKYRSTDDSEIVAIRASSLNRDSLKFLFRSKEVPPLKPVYQEQKENYHNHEMSKIEIQKMRPVMSKGSLKQYEDVQKLQVKQIDENIQDSDDSLTNEQQLNEEYINNTILNEDILINKNDVDNNNGKLSNNEKGDLKKRKHVIQEDPLLKAINYRQSFSKISLKDSDTVTNSGMFSKYSKSEKSLLKYNNSSSTSLKIDKLVTDVIIAKNTSLKTGHTKSLHPLKDSDSGTSSNKYRNMMKSKFTKSVENITKCLKDEYKESGGGDNELKAISVSGFKKSESKLLNKKNINTNTDTTKTSNNKPKYSHNKINEKHDEHRVHLSPTRKIKSKSEIINDVLNSPKVLRVVIPRVSVLEQKSIKKQPSNILKIGLNNIEKSLISDLNRSKISIYKDDGDQQQPKGLEDPLKGTDIDPLQLDDDEIISHLQNIDENKKNYELEKSKNNEKYDLDSTPADDEFDLFAKQKLINISNIDNKKNIDKNECNSRSESQSSQQNNITTKLSTNSNETSDSQFVNDNKLDDKFNASQPIKRSHKKMKSRRNMKKRKSKLSKITQESKKEKDNIKNNIEIETVMQQETAIQTETYNKETNPEITNTTSSKSEILTLTKSSNQEKILDIIINSPKTENVIIPKSSNEENVTTSMVTVNEAPSVDINKSAKLPKTPKTNEIIRSKRIASRNQSSTDSHSSSLREISFENKDNPKQISHSLRSSRDRTSNSSDQKKNCTNSPVAGPKTNLMMEGRSKNLKNIKIDESNKIVELSASSKNSNEVNITDTKQDSSTSTKIIDDEKKNSKSIEKIDSNTNTNQKPITPLHSLHLTRQRTSLNEEIGQITAINQKDDKLKKIEMLETANKTQTQKKATENLDLKNNDTQDMLSSKENKKDKLVEKDVSLTNNEIKMISKDVKEGNKLEGQSNDSIDTESKMEASKKDSNILLTLSKTIEIPPSTSIEKESKNEDKSKTNDEEKEKEKIMKSIRRTNRELKLLAIDNKPQHIFIEPTIMTRATRLRTKRSAGGNPIQIAPQKPAAKIIRRRQSNIIQITRKEYDRVVNERRAAADARIQQNTSSPSPPALIPFNVNNEKPLLKIVENDKEILNKNKLKTCKIVLDRLELKFKKPKILPTTEQRNSINDEIITEFAKELTTLPIDNSSPRMSVESISSVKTAKKRKLKNSKQEISSEPKSVKTSDDQHLEKIQDNTKLSKEVKTVEKEGIVEKNIINSELCDDNKIKDKNNSDKLTISNVSPVIIIEKLDETIYKESTNKLVEIRPILPETLDKIENKSATLELTTATNNTSDNNVKEDISQKSKDIKTTSKNLQTAKSKGKIHISSKFLPLKTDRSNKDNDCRPGRLKKYKSTPNLNLIINDEDNQSNNKVTVEKASVSGKQQELNQIETAIMASENLPITSNEAESTTLSDIITALEQTKQTSTNKESETKTRSSKRKLSESQSINDSKKQKLLTSNDEKSTETTLSGKEKQNETETETDQIISSPILASRLTAAQVKKNSKPQIFIAAPENISRRRNSESNLHENGINENNTPNNNLDFSIESWFQDIPSLLTSSHMETTTDILPEISSILSSTTKSADENEETIVQQLHLASITPQTESTPSTTTTTQTSVSQIPKTTNWPLTSSSNQQTQLQKPQTPQITCTPDISSYSITTPPSTFQIPNIKSINIPAHIVVQTKFLTRDQYNSKLMKNSLQPSSTNSTSSNNIPSNLINNNLSSGNSSLIINKISDQLNSARILERISDLLETQIDTEVRRKMQELIENKTAEDQLRIERLRNIKKIGYASNFCLQTLVFLQNYFFNTPTVRNNDDINNVSNINNNNRNIGKELSNKSANSIIRNEDFSFRKIRLPIQNTNNSNNNLQQNTPNRTSVLTKLNTNSPINSNNYTISGTINVGLNNNTSLQNNLIYNKPTTISPMVKRTGIIQSDGTHNLSKNIPTSSIKLPSLTLRQSSSGHGEPISTKVFLNSTNNTCEAAITNEPESILPDQTIVPPLLQTEIKEETVEESIIS